VKHATANTLKPASINVEPSDIVPLAVTETPFHGKSHSSSQSTEYLGTLAIPIWYFLAYLVSLLIISIWPFIHVPRANRVSHGGNAQ
jgi:hypothetical protein